MNCTVYEAKVKALISCAVMRSSFVTLFRIYKNGFSHDAAHMKGVHKFTRKYPCVIAKIK